MNHLKKIQSIFLLFVIFTQILHTLVPHCNILQDTTTKINYKSQCSHKFNIQHYSNNIISSDTKLEIINKKQDFNNKISHADHYDNNLFDLLICVLSEMEHKDIDLYRNRPDDVINKDISHGELNLLQSILILNVAFSNLINAHSVLNFEPETPFSRTKLLSKTLFFRGPPTIS